MKEVKRDARIPGWVLYVDGEEYPMSDEYCRNLSDRMLAMLRRCIREEVE